MGVGVCECVQHVTSIGRSASSLDSEIRLSVFCIKASRHRRHGTREVASSELLHPTPTAYGSLFCDSIHNPQRI